MKPHIKYTRVQFENAVLGLLRRGKACAITCEKLANVLESDDRRVRLTILALIKRRIPIAASVSNPKGFFIVENYEEAREYEENLKSRIKHDQIRLTAFKKAMETYVEPKQLVMIK